MSQYIIEMNKRHDVCCVCMCVYAVCVCVCMCVYVCVCVCVYLIGQMSLVAGCLLLVSH